MSLQSYTLLYTNRLLRPAHTIWKSSITQSGHLLIPHIDSAGCLGRGPPPSDGARWEVTLITIVVQKDCMHALPAA